MEPTSRRRNHVRLENYDDVRAARVRNREEVLQLDAEHNPAAVIAGLLKLTRGQVAGILHRYGSSEGDNAPPKKAAPKKPRAPKKPQPPPPPPPQPPYKPQGFIAVGSHQLKKPDGEPLTDGDLVPGEAVDIDRETWVATPHEGRITIAELRPSMCRFPIGDPRDWEGFRFCGALIHDLGPYCLTHHKLCTMKAK